MSHNNFYEKYQKYKKKYIEQKLKKCVYVIHSPLQFENLTGILVDGIVKLGTDIPEDLRNLSKYEPLPYVFGRFLFINVKETYIYWNCLIFDSEIMNDYNFYFNKGWFAGPTTDSIKFQKTDSLKKKLINICDAKEKIINHNSLGAPVMNHELIFSRPIDVKKYLRAIIFFSNDKNETMKISKLVNDYYDNVKIYSSIDDFVDMNDLQSFCLI